MTFRETLGVHLGAIQGRDLGTLMSTVSPDSLTLITANGRVVRTAAEFAGIYQSWFSSMTWTLDVSMVSIVEGPSLGVATLLLEYRDDQEDGPTLERKGLLTLAFAHRAGAWEMVLAQNTPIRPQEPAEAQADA